MTIVTLVHCDCCVGYPRAAPDTTDDSSVGRGPGPRGSPRPGRGRAIRAARRPRRGLSRPRKPPPYVSRPRRSGAIAKTSTIVRRKPSETDSKRFRRVRRHTPPHTWLSTADAGMFPRWKKGSGTGLHRGPPVVWRWYGARHDAPPRCTGLCMDHRQELSHEVRARLRTSGR